MDVMVGFQRIHLMPGDFIFGRKNAAKELRITERSIRTSLQHLEKSQNVTIKTTNKFSVISIVNWQIYQGEDMENDQQTANKRPASDQQVTTNKNVKNVKNVKKDIYTSNFEIFWKAYPKKIGKAPALKVWLKLKSDDALITNILSALEIQKKTAQWQDQQYIPYPTTWLNQQRWNDEVKEENNYGQQQRDRYGRSGLPELPEEAEKCLREAREISKRLRAEREATTQNTTLDQTPKIPRRDYGEKLRVSA